MRNIPMAPHIRAAAQRRIRMICSFSNRPPAHVKGGESQGRLVTGLVLGTDRRRFLAGWFWSPRGLRDPGPCRAAVGGRELAAVLSRNDRGPGIGRANGREIRR